MKKAISLLLVLAVALSLSSMAFAATDIPGTYTVPESNAGISPITGMNPAIAPRIVLDTPAEGSTAATYGVEAGELFLVSGNNVVGTDTELIPAETYKFDIYFASAAVTGDSAAILASDDTKLLRKSDLGDASVRVRTMKGSSSIQSAKIRSVGSRGSNLSYQLEIETRANYGTKQTDVEYTLSVYNAPAGSPFNESTHTFIVGFGLFSDSTDIGEDGIVTISNDNPVITKDLFSEMAKSANYKNVTFEAEDGNWIYRGKIAGMKDTNFSYNYDPDTDLMNKFPDQEFKFLTFPGGVNFPTVGEMRIDVSDISGDFSSMHAYLYRDGRLTEINGTYDSGADELIFRTNYLGKFVITNDRITDTSILAEEREPDEEDDIIDEEEEYYPPTYNPETGAGSANTMMLFGLMTLASAAVVIRKRG